MGQSCREERVKSTQGSRVCPVTIVQKNVRNSTRRSQKTAPEHKTLKQRHDNFPAVDAECHPVRRHQFNDGPVHSLIAGDHMAVDDCAVFPPEAHNAGEFKSRVWGG